MTCIAVLIKYCKAVMFERLIRSIETKPTHHMQIIGTSHRQCAEIRDKITSIKSWTEWIVQSSTSEANPYSVNLNTKNMCPGCPLACPKCNV